MEGEEDIHTLDKPMETNMAEIEDKPDWANLPDLAFNEIMMKRISLRTCMRVCSSWKERITKNILENRTKKNIIKARSERAMGSGMVCSSEDFCNFMFFSKYEHLLSSPGCWPKTLNPNPKPTNKF